MRKLLLLVLLSVALVGCEDIYPLTQVNDVTVVDVKDNGRMASTITFEDVSGNKFILVNEAIRDADYLLVGSKYHIKFEGSSLKVITPKLDGVQNLKSESGK